MRQTKNSKFPPGWDADRVRRVLAHYEDQSDAEAVAEDEAAFDDGAPTMMAVPRELVPAVRELIARRQRRAPSRRRAKPRSKAGRA
jgi:hypothetical protein